MNLTGETVLYPLAVGNKWIYKMSAGGTYINSITGMDAANPTLFSMLNSSTNLGSFMRKDGDIYYTNGYDANVFHPYLKDDFTVGANWVVQYTANGITTDMTMTVTSAGIAKDVEGKTYNNVTSIKGDCKFSMNGTPLPTTYSAEYFYAKGIGLVLTTSSNGDAHVLTDYDIH